MKRTTKINKVLKALFEVDSNYLKIENLITQQLSYAHNFTEAKTAIDELPDDECLSIEVIYKYRSSLQFEVNFAEGKFEIEGTAPKWVHNLLAA